MDDLLKKSIVNLGILASLTIIPFTSQVMAAPTAQEELLEDSILAMLFPEIGKALEQHFGEYKQFFCDDVLRVTKLYPGSFNFEITVQVQTFEGAHNPPYHLVTITFDNSSIGWRVKDFKVKKLAPGKGRKCRKPVQFPLNYEG